MAIFNSDICSFVLKKFVKHNQDIEINDTRQIPVIIPTTEQEFELVVLAQQCMALKRAAFGNESLSQELVAEVREWAKRLSLEAPPYLRPSAQLTFATAPQDCLTILERAVSWSAEKLYDVAGQGPFDEF